MAVKKQAGSAPLDEDGNVKTDELDLAGAARHFLRVTDDATPPVASVGDQIAARSKLAELAGDLFDEDGVPQ